MIGWWFLPSWPEELLTRRMASCSSSAARGTLKMVKWRWKRIFSEQEAMATLKSKLSEEQVQGTNFASVIADSFHSCGLVPNMSAYSFTIKNLCQRSLFSHLPPVLDHLEKVEKFETSETMFVELIKMYGAAKMLDEAFEIFFRIPNFRCRQSTESLNTLLSILHKTDKGLVLIGDLLVRIHQVNVRLDATSFWILVKFLCKQGKVHYAVELLDEMSIHECMPDPRMYSFILSHLCRSASSVVLLNFLGKIREAGSLPSCKDYNNVMKSLIRGGEVGNAYSVFTQMRCEGISPDIVAYTSLLDGFISSGEYAKADDIFDEFLLSGLIPDLSTYNTYITGLCKRGDFKQADQMMVSMEKLGCKPDAMTYNILMAAYCNAGKLLEAKEVKNKMQEKGTKWNHPTYMILIVGLLRKGEIVDAHTIFGDMLSKGFPPQSSVFDDLICGYCEIGLHSKAIILLEDMVSRSLAPETRTWHALLDVKFDFLKSSPGITISMQLYEQVWFSVVNLYNENGVENDQ